MYNCSVKNITWSNKIIIITYVKFSTLQFSTRDYTFCFNDTLLNQFIKMGLYITCSDLIILYTYTWVSKAIRTCIFEKLKCLLIIFLGLVIVQQDTNRNGSSLRGRRHNCYSWMCSITGRAWVNKYIFRRTFFTLSSLHNGSYHQNWPIFSFFCCWYCCSYTTKITPYVLLLFV